MADYFLFEGHIFEANEMADFLNAHLEEMVVDKFLNANYDGEFCVLDYRLKASDILKAVDREAYDDFRDSLIEDLAEEWVDRLADMDVGEEFKPHFDLSLGFTACDEVGSTE